MQTDNEFSKVCCNGTERPQGAGAGLGQSHWAGKAVLLAAPSQFECSMDTDPETMADALEL